MRFWNIKTCLFLLFIGIVILLNLNFISKDEYESDQFRKIIESGVDSTLVQIKKLNKTAHQFNNNEIDVLELQKQLLETRKAYKSVEFILEYYYPEHIKAYINGAPLPHLDPFPIDETDTNKTSYGLTPSEYIKSKPLDYLDNDQYKISQKVVEPIGLQVLDEIIFSENPDKEKVVQLSSQVVEDFQILEKAIKKRGFYNDFEIVEAVRLELVRVFSMGITGFDTPGSSNAIEESSASLKKLQEITSVYLDKNSSTENDLDQLFNGALIYLKSNTDFDKFDRLTFLVDYINPLYSKVLGLQKQNHIKSRAEVEGETPSWNAYSNNIFAEDFLNPYYYSLLKENNDSPELRNLGKKLFFDTSLSNNGNISCASCHKPELAFTDGEPKSLSSILGEKVKRNSPTLINAVFADRYFYDMRAFDLEEQAEHVVENHLEFDTDFSKLVKKLNDTPEYQKLFEKVNGNRNPITRYQFSSALASYLISLRSFSTPFDNYVQGKTKNISNDVRLGFNLFMGKAGCATCHFAPTFSGLVPPLYRENESEVLGVFEHPKNLIIDKDNGRIANGLEKDTEEIYRYSFKTTTIRNAKLTAPYFHNGAYKTLTEVIDFYNKGGAVGQNLGYELPYQTLPGDKLKLTRKEKKALIAFIESLTDSQETFLK